LKRKNLYYVAEKGMDHLFNAGIVRKDNETILYSMGFEALHFSYHQKKSFYISIQRFFKLLQFFFSINKKSLVIFHFPLLATIYKWLLVLLKWRGINTAAIIIDIDGLRDRDISLLNKEIKLLNYFKYIVAHNAAMKAFLLQKIPGANIHTIDLFDYPVNGEISYHTYNSTICFAGSIKKSAFIYSVKQTAYLRLNVYGDGYDADRNTADGFCYKGVFKPALLPAQLEGSFGLVWDGNSIDVCDEYLKYNNPHKLSLYLAAGLPVIVWEQSAVAKLVKEKNIGITVNRLSETEQKIKLVSNEEYKIMQQNAAAIGNRLCNGFYLKQVIEKIKSNIS
jgi:glycosyltransferase involved in cell wall biosynthesis